MSFVLRPLNHFYHVTTDEELRQLQLRNAERIEAAKAALGTRYLCYSPQPHPTRVDVALPLFLLKKGSDQ